VIAPEGAPFVGLGVAILVLAAAAAWLLGGAWWIAPAAWLPIALWVPWFFRNPDRSGHGDPGVVLAPADGKVVSVTRVADADFMGGEALRVSIFMNVFNVHVNRVPVDGTVEHRDYRPGAFFNATLDKASELNEQMSLGIRTAQGPVVVRQIAGLVARRIVCDHHPGDRVQQGSRLGLIRFGSRVDTFLPSTVDVRVAVGDHTVAGQTRIAVWRREESA
jgi:phosphatidylserine decarboxylase